MLRRLEVMIGEKINILKESNIIIFGLGGVGGYVAEMLARSGMGKLTLVDYDLIDISNKNRQIIATDAVLGQSKVDEWKNRIHLINQDCEVVSINEKLLSNNIDFFNLDQYDFVIDAIDMVKSKLALIDYCFKNNIPIVSAMGAGNRIEIPECVVGDIYETNNDGLAKVLRHNLRKLGVTRHPVVYFKNKSIAIGENNVIGSVAYYPAISGAMTAAYVINKLLNK